MKAVKLAIVGMGMIGKRHHQAMKTLKEAELIAIVDPAEQAKEIALNEGIRWFAKIEEMLAEVVPEGVIVSTPTEIHLAPPQCFRSRLPCTCRKTDCSQSRGSQTDSANFKTS